jgi:hypothetical protein
MEGAPGKFWHECPNKVSAECGKCQFLKVGASKGEIVWRQHVDTAPVIRNNVQRSIGRKPHNAIWLPTRYPKAAFGIERKTIRNDAVKLESERDVSSPSWHFRHTGTRRFHDKEPIPSSASPFGKRKGGVSSRLVYPPGSMRMIEPSASASHDPESLT